MFNKWFFLLNIFIAAILQVTLLDGFKLFNVKPDLLLIAVVLAGIYLNLKWALVLGVFSGSLKDILSLNSFGINTLLFPLWSFLVVKTSRKISLDNNFISATLLFIIVVFNDIIIKLIYFSLRQQFIPTGIFLRTVFIESFYTAVIFFLIFKLSKDITYGAKRPPQILAGPPKI